MNSSADVSAPRNNSDDASKPWWKYPMVWMVIGGPLAVVVACIVTWFFIMRAPEQVLDQTQEVNTDQLTVQKGAAYAPSQKARNHAATGYQPASR